MFNQALLGNASLSTSCKVGAWGEKNGGGGVLWNIPLFKNISALGALFRLKIEVVWDPHPLTASLMIKIPGTVNLDENIGLVQLSPVNVTVRGTC